jgi:hypothetical protein
MCWLSRSIFSFLSTFTIVGLTIAEEPAASVPSAQTPSQSTRYGLFNLLDHRSSYGQGAFPEPFLVDDSDLEVGETRLDWLRTKANDQHSDLVKAEVEQGFGLLTLELAVPFERHVSAGSVSEGVGNLEVAARYPIYQFVSSNGFADATFGAAMEASIPVHSSVSKNTGVIPKIFNDLRLGDHFTLQSIVGFSTLFGGGPDGGLQTLEYGFVFGYTIQREELRVPGVQQIIPVFELAGETDLNKGNAGQTSLMGNLGLRANLRTIGAVQPRPGLGFVFPINKAARQDTHWGVFLSLVFDY